RHGPVVEIGALAGCESDATVGMATWRQEHTDSGEPGLRMSVRWGVNLHWKAGRALLRRAQWEEALSVAPTGHRLHLSQQITSIKQ
ncbi:MAG: hypothetical protein ABI040_01040, partial [Rhodoferax sp.]